MRKVYKKLMEEQKARSVIFSSCLSTQRTEQLDDTIHEVFKGEEAKIERLLDDKFFNKNHFRFNIIRG